MTDEDIEALRRALLVLPDAMDMAIRVQRLDEDRRAERRAMSSIEADEEAAV